MHFAGYFEEASLPDYFVCRACGSLVKASSLVRHVEFHEKVNK